MNKYFKSALLVICLLLISFFTSTVLAAVFSVTKIGALDLGGHTYPEWWYTGTNPTFYGTGESGAQVKIKIEDKEYTATADTSGNWSYYAQLEKGDYDLVFSQGTSSYAFILHLGQALPDNLGSTPQTTQSTVSVPTTGSNQVAAIGFGLGIALLASYFYINGDTDKRALFEKKVIREG